MRWQQIVAAMLAGVTVRLCWEVWTKYDTDETQD